MIVRIPLFDRMGDTSSVFRLLFTIGTPSSTLNRYAAYRFALAVVRIDGLCSVHPGELTSSITGKTNWS
jgi:hypothetical protein